MKGVVDFNMEIYDRWGAMIFETANMDGGWDGTLLNQKVQNDVFNYKIFVTDNCNDKHSYIGKVTLLK
jgi:gliding motility-associated-like protein